jgi:chromosomal replication initiation ATPase DnaA
MQQSILNFKYNEEYKTEDFIVSQSNQVAFDILHNFQKSWGTSLYPYTLLITGPKGSGKTHLAHIWQGISLENITVENIDATNTLDEEDLLHIFNSCNENKKFLLLTSALPANQIQFKLPDLDSRIKSIMEVKIYEPDDYLVKMILFKHFSKRSIKIEDNVMNYLESRLPRNFNEINLQINLLDEASLRHKKDITIPFIRKILNLTL